MARNPRLYLVYIVTQYTPLYWAYMYYLVTEFRGLSATDRSAPPGSPSLSGYHRPVSTPPHVLSIDLGTGGPKAALVRTDGTLAAAASRPVQTVQIPPDGAEQDPEEIWDAIRSATREVVARADIPADAIAGVCVASQFS
ncbi:MAG: FGGY family carbohydrate kinase, partial [Myxococcota bacterium]